MMGSALAPVADPILRAVDLGKTYPDGTRALSNVHLTVARGEMLYIKGPSGAGKTTLFRLIAGMEDPTSGQLEVNGVSMPGRGTQPRDLRRTMGIIFQDFRLLGGWSVLENLQLGVRVLGLRLDSAAAMDYLAQVDLSHRAQAQVAALSWGERQRLEVARALVRKPQLILADEPTGNLDAPMSERVIALLERANAGGATVIVVTHASALLAAPAGRVITLEAGRLTAATAGGDHRVSS